MFKRVRVLLLFFALLLLPLGLFLHINHNLWSTMKFRLRLKTGQCGLSAE